MRRFITMIFAAAALAVGALPASAGNSTPTGSKLPINFNRSQSPITIQANTAFFIKGGFVVDDPNGGYCGGAGQPVCDTVSDVQQSQVDLFVDGKKQNGTTTQEFTDTKPPTLFAKWFLYNFPTGVPVGGPYQFRVDYTIRGTLGSSATTPIYAVATCPYGTITTNPGAGLICAPPPA
jgi:hypothetical protein